MKMKPGENQIMKHNMKGIDNINLCMDTLSESTQRNGDIDKYNKK